MSLNLIGKIHPMITESTSPFLHFESGKNEPGMTLQRLNREWVDYKVDGRWLSHLLILKVCLLVGIGWCERAASD
jgi:hypothetical protein